jgi:hypothetical protein
MEEVPHTIFVRHSMNITEDALSELRDEERIAIHHKDSPSTTPADYDERGETEMQKLNDVAADGAAVTAYYADLDSSEMLVGTIEPQKIEVRRFPHEENEGKERIYKTLQFDESGIVTFQDCPVLFTAHSRQGWSICNWQNASEQARAVAIGNQLSRTVGSLSSGQLETLCERYLYVERPDFFTVIPVGGELKEVDIAGHDNCSEVVAQVTHSRSPSETHNKLDALVQYVEPDTEVIFFGHEKHLEDSGVDIHPDIQYKPIQKVFEAVDDDSKGSRMISEMLEVPA